MHTRALWCSCQTVMCWLTEIILRVTAVSFSIRVRTPGRGHNSNVEQALALAPWRCLLPERLCWREESLYTAVERLLLRRPISMISRATLGQVLVPSIKLGTGTHSRV